MCENNVVAFGMNGTEIMLTVSMIALIIALFIALVSYLNGSFTDRRIDFIDVDLYSKEELKHIRKYGR